MIPTVPIKDEWVTMTCPKCDKQMIKKFIRFSTAVSPRKAAYQWFCRCGHTENGGNDMEYSEQEFYQERWDRAQKKAEKPIVPENRPPAPHHKGPRPATLERLKNPPPPKPKKKLGRPPKVKPVVDEPPVG